MPKKYPADVHDGAVRRALDRLGDYSSAWSACQALTPKLDIGAAALIYRVEVLA